MMREELGLEEPDPKRARRSAVAIGLSYVAGCVIPLAPYALGLTLGTAFRFSIVVTALALLAFGAAKAHFTGVGRLKGALQDTPMQVEDRPNVETVATAGSTVLETIKNLAHEGNIRRIVVKHDGKTIAEFPLTFGVVGAALAPAWPLLEQSPRY